MTDPRDSLQQALGNAYTLERELGGGGMSRTYLARDTSLNRRVVVKLLSPDLAVGVSVDRFKREIQLAAALQHPHIVPVLAAGEADGLPYYTMPFVAGESLRMRLAQGALPIAEVIGVLRDVAKALAFAHEQGVVHRDIKPDNVLLSGGSAAVADFGIAKAITAARSDQTRGPLTQTGTSIGTPAYMAPEQAAGDPGTDQRADLYAFGVMGYEMLAGHAPFHGLTPQRMLAAQMSERPRDIVQVRGDVPPALAELVMRCLEKDADHRPQGAADIVRYLDGLSTGSGQAGVPAVLPGSRVSLVRALVLYAGAFVAVAVLARAAIVGIGLPDWVFPGAMVVMALGLPPILFTAYVQRTARRVLTATPTLTPGGSPVGHGTMAAVALRASPHVSWRRTATMGFAAVGTLVVLVSAWMATRALGIGPSASLIASGKLGARERVILAEFKGPATDSLLGPTVTEAFRTDLAQSASLVVMPAGDVRAALQLMQRAATERVDYGVAREIATREGIKAVIDGEVVSLGGSYVLSARLVSAQDGAELATFRQTADDAKDIIPAISRLSKSVREKVGESLPRVQAAPTREQVTTPALHALRKYVAATRAIEVDGDFARFEELMTQAIALDTSFAMAYRKLAVELSNRSLDRPRVRALLQKAHDNSDRLSEAERYIMLGSYHQNGPKPDNDKAIAALESLLEIDSTNVTALNNLAVLFRDRREFGRAADLSLRAIRLQPTTGVFYNNAIYNLLSLGKADSAAVVLALQARNIPRNPSLAFNAARIAVERGRLDAATAVLDSLTAARAKDLPTRRTASFNLGYLDQLQGRLGAAAGHYTVGRTLARQLGNPRAAIQAILDSAYVDSWYRGDTARARRAVERAAAHPVFDSLPEEQRPWDAMAFAYAEVGLPDRARAALRRTEAQPDAQTEDGQRDLQYVRGMIARAEGRHEDAIRALRASLGGPCLECGYGDLAIAYDKAGQEDSTIAVLTRYVNARALGASNMSRWLPYAYKRLAELHDGKGQVEQAMSNYERFIDLWKKSDPELQPAVQRARARVTELQRRRG